MAAGLPGKRATFRKKFLPNDEKTYRTRRAKEGGQKLPQLCCVLLVWFQQHCQKLWRQAISENALHKEPDGTDVDPGTKGLQLPSETLMLKIKDIIYDAKFQRPALTCLQKYNWGHTSPYAEALHCSSCDRFESALAFKVFAASL